MFTQTDASAAARMASLPAGSVQLEGGFWGPVHRRTLEVTVAAMADDLFDPGVGHAWENFRIAAGDVEGDHAGPPFMDGDFYKWLEAAVVAYGYTADSALRARIDAAVDVIVRSQRADGYLHTPTLIDEVHAGGAAELQDRLNFETYNLGHLMTAGCIHHRVTGEDDLLGAAIRAADYLRFLVSERRDLIARSAICPSHYMGVVELFRTTGEPAYLRLAQDLLEIRDRVDGGDDNQDRVPLRSQRTVAGHAVRANYLYAGAADVALETGEPEVVALLERLWSDAVDTRLHLTGGCGALYDGASPDGAPDQGTIARVHQAYGRPYQLPNTTAHNESCAAIGMVLWTWRMLLITGNGRYADLIERIIYNGLLAAVGVDATSFFYTNPLRQVRDLPFPLRRAGDTALSPVPEPPASDARLRQHWLSCYCCPPNIARTLAELPYLVYAARGDEVWVHQFAASTARLRFAGADAVITQRTDYPATGTVRIGIGLADPVRGTLRVRIPAWAEGATISVAGVVIERREAGYAVIERRWEDGDEVVLELPLRVRRVVGHRLAEEISNQVAFVRGPVVYCLESPELPSGATIERVLVPRYSAAIPAPLPQEWGPVPALRVAGLLAPRSSSGALYAELPAGDPTPLDLLLVPYAFWANRGPSEMSVWLNLAW